MHTRGQQGTKKQPVIGGFIQRTILSELHAIKPRLIHLIDIQVELIVFCKLSKPVVILTAKRGADKDMEQ